MEKFNGKMCPLSIDDADNAYSYMPDVSEKSSFVYGVESFKEQVKEAIPGVYGAAGGLLYETGKKLDKYFPDGIKLFNGAIDIKIGDELKSAGDTLINTANRQIEIFEEEYKKKNPRLEKAQENLAFDIGNQGANWTSLLLAGSVGAAGKAMGGLVLSGEFKERAEKYKQEHGGSLEGFTEEYSDDAAYNVANAYVQGVEEKYLGSWAQVKSVKKGWGFVKAIGKNAVQEGFVEEPLQDVTDFYFDKVDGFNKDEELKDRLKNNLRGYVVASVFGGAGGFAGALAQRSQGIDMYKEALKNTVPEEDLENVATKAYEQDAKTLKDVVVVEIENSSSLRNRRGKVFENMYNSTVEAIKDAKSKGAYSELETEDDIASYAQAESERFADWTLAEATRRNTVLEEVIDAEKIAYKDGKLEIGMTTEGGIDTEYNQIAQRINEIDEEEAQKGVPEYTEQTININGVDRQTTNSDGNPIAKSKRSLEYFYKWFGDSKVVDEQGRPLVVYHSTDVEFSVFDKTKADSSVGLPAFYFSSSEQYSREYGSITMPAYLKAENVFNIGKDVPDGWYELKTNEERIDLLKKQGYDGVFDYNAGATEYAVFNPNQIKSTSNRGTYSESENIYLQSAFAGSGVDYEKPSLEAIGSGEGAQVHGWGLYYALDREVAEGYRERSYASREGQREHSLNADFETLTVNGKPLLDVYNVDMDRSLYNDLLYKPYGTVEAEIEDRIAGWEDRLNDSDYSFKDYAKEKIDAYKRLKEDLFNNGMSLIKKDYGQVHEVDIPENPYLLDEQAGYEAQPELVKKVFDRISEEFGIKTKGTLQVGNEQKEINGKYVYNHLADKLGSPRQASMWLNEQGIKGITYDGGRDGRCFVIFNPEDVKVIQKFYQGEKGSIEFRGDKALINLTERADSTTLPHELAHYYLQNTFLYTKSGLASAEYMNNFNQIAQYLGITPDQENIKDWQQEKFARAYELYQMGNTPEGMDKPLTQYNQWLRKAYDGMQEPMYRDENGEMKVPEFDYDTMKMFASLAGETLTEPQFKENKERVRGLAKSTSEMAKQKGIETETPMYEPRSSTEMGKKADEFIKNNKQLAVDIVKGLAPEQDGLFRQDLFAALRELALNEGDSDLLNELSRSMTVEEATELGQRIQALSRGTVDPVKQMTELRDERMKKEKVTKEKIKEETKKATKEIKKEIALAAQPKEWQDFIKSLEC